MEFIKTTIAANKWLNPKIKGTNKLQNLLVPYPADEMSSHTVNRAVSSPAEDAPKLILNSK